MLLEDMLEDLGCKTLGPLTRVGEALAFIAEHGQEIDIAILDVNLAGERSQKVAAVLRAAGTPFILSTGYDDFRRRAKAMAWRLRAAQGQLHGQPAGKRSLREALVSGPPDPNAPRRPPRRRGHSPG